jgi:hypothetical protein
MAVAPLETGGPVARLRRTRLRALPGPERRALQERQRCQCLATLALPQEARQDWAEPLGGDGVKALAQVGVARDPLQPGEGVPSVLAPLLVKGEERGRFEGKQGARGPQRLRSSKVGLAQAVRREGRQAVSPQTTEGSSREMLPCFGSHHGPENPHHAHMKAFTSGGMFASRFTKGQDR